jgi:RNA polymerase sigma-70 factor (ECF subfamily)
MADLRPDLGAVYEEYVWDLYGFFAYHRLSRQDAEDLTQATFERAAHAYARYDPKRASVKTWLMAIAHNLLIDHYRRDSLRRHAPLDDISESETGSVMGPEEDLGLSPELAQALEQLSDREREVIAFRFGGELTGPEIAELLDLNLANVQQIASRALRKLRVKLEGADEIQPAHRGS